MDNKDTSRDDNAGENRSDSNDTNDSSRLVNGDDGSNVGNSSNSSNVGNSVTGSPTSLDRSRLTPDQLTPLDRADAPTDSPLAYPVFDVQGTLLLNDGAVLDGALWDRFYQHFEPYVMRSEDAAEAATGGAGIRRGATQANGANTPFVPPEVADAAAIAAMSLRPGTRLGIRLPMGAGRVAYASRLIGVAPHGPLFVMPPMLDQQRLALQPGEIVEVVAVGERTVYLFAAAVEALPVKPFHYVVLSQPSRVRKLRERRDRRVRTRLAVFYASAVAETEATPATAGQRGLAVALDLSPSGMAVSTDEPIGESGSRVRVFFDIETQGVPVRIEAECEIRNVRQRHKRGRPRPSTPPSPVARIAGDMTTDAAAPSDTGVASGAAGLPAAGGGNESADTAESGANWHTGLAFVVELPPLQRLAILSYTAQAAHTVTVM